MSEIKLSAPGQPNLNYFFLMGRMPGAQENGTIADWK